MDPIDTAFRQFCTLTEADLPQFSDSLLSEADVRMKLIDPIFVRVLGWPVSSVFLESSAGPGFIDYRCEIDGLNRLVIEAKRTGRDLGISPERTGRAFKLNGPVFDSPHAKEGIDQAIKYCGYKNAELACVTNGYQWIVFRGNRRGDGRDTMEGYAFVFGSLDGVKKSFKRFYDLLAYESVRGYVYRGEFHQAEGQPVRTSNFTSPVRRPDSRRLLPGDKLYADIDRVMLSFFRDLSGDDDPELRRRCFVVSKESTQAEEGLTRISEELRDRVKALRTDNAEGLTRTIQRVQETQRREFVLLVGTKGAGKSTFIDRFFEDILPRDTARDTKSG
jgi:hypothetical protein